MPEPADLRRPLAAGDLRPPPGTIWTDVRSIAATPSSNDELAAAARAGAEHGTVLLAEEQTSGRGRRDRSWSAPPRSSLMVSALLRPRADPSTWGWVPLLTAVAVAETVMAAGLHRPQVKWPNDVLVSGRKIAGVLCEVVPPDAPAARSARPAVVAGWGLNVSQTVSELPGASATSLLLEHADTDRPRLLRHALDRWSHWYRQWDGGDIASVRGAYEALSSTLGAQVRATLPGGRTVEGAAVRLAEGGGLVVSVDGADVEVVAADVVHVRPLLPP